MEEEKSIDPTAASNAIENSIENKKLQISFSDNMWGSIDAIRENSKKGVMILEGLSNFSKGFHRSYEIYSSNLTKALEHFEKDVMKYNCLDTTTIWMSSLCSEMRNMINNMKIKISEFDDLIYLPLVSFTKHYVDQNKKWIDDSKKYINEVEVARRSVIKSQSSYQK